MSESAPSDFKAADSGAPASHFTAGSSPLPSTSAEAVSLPPAVGAPAAIAPSTSELQDPREATAPGPSAQDICTCAGGGGLAARTVSGACSAASRAGDGASRGHCGEVSRRMAEASESVAVISSPEDNMFVDGVESEPGCAPAMRGLAAVRLSHAFASPPSPAALSMPVAATPPSSTA